jgi:hypothetical protein
VSPDRSEAGLLREPPEAGAPPTRPEGRDGKNREADAHRAASWPQSPGAPGGASGGAGDPAARKEAERLVAALEAGATLTSAERVQLVLALGRALLAEGVLPREALLDELSKP